MKSSMPAFLLYSDLNKLILSQEVTIVLETVQMLETSAASEPLAPFEIDFASKFIKSSMLTSFPDFR